MAKNTNNSLRSYLITLIAIVIAIDFVLVLKFILRDTNVALLNPKGTISEQQVKLAIYVTVILLIIGVLTLIALYLTAWKYRESNHAATYQPTSYSGKRFIIAIWLIPSVFAAVIAVIMYSATHRLAPQKVIEHQNKPMTIQVVSMNWKWLFLYPEQDIATVNFVQFPVDRPVTFEMTADEAPMSSFWIPNLGGQLYTMTSHVNKLNLLAETPGDYPGKSAEINGKGFAGMTFTARASSETEFNEWVNKVKQTNNDLSSTQYDDLLEPSENHPVTAFSSYENNLFAKVIQKYYQPQEVSEHNE